MRNLQPLSFSPHPQTNFIMGPNGSGKTSLLEAIAILSSGRSFRTPDTKKVITQQQSELVVFAKVGSESQAPFRLGISKDTSGNTIAKQDGERVHKVSSLAKVLPTVAIETSSLEVVEGGPAVRRSLLDWGLFHVEHSYLEVWNQYRQAYKQKNALLKATARRPSLQDLSYWNALLGRYGDRLQRERSLYVEALETQVQRIATHYFHLSEPLSLRYRPGWNVDEFPHLADCLAQKSESEIDRKSCLYGPHRAELEFLWGGTLVKDICSRGQKKLVLYAVRLAQIAMMIERIGVSPILMLDDLPAEMDKKNINNVSRFLTEFPCQTFITAINQQSIDDTLMAGLKEHQVFHVEHGTLR